MSSTSGAGGSNPCTHGLGWAGVVRIRTRGIDVLIAGGIFGRLRMMRQAVRALHAIGARAFYRFLFGLGRLSWHTGLRMPTSKPRTALIASEPGGPSSDR